jgi:hypothetical protein
MDLVVFENNKPHVIDEFREGRLGLNCRIAAHPLLTAVFAAK